MCSCDLLFLALGMGQRFAGLGFLGIVFCCQFSKAGTFALCFVLLLDFFLLRRSQLVLFQWPSGFIFAFPHVCELAVLAVSVV